MKMAVVMLGYLFAGFQPEIAQATGAMEPLPWWGQLGVCGMIGFLHWWTIGRTIPGITESQERGMNALSGEIKGLRDDFGTASERQLGLLEEMVRRDAK